MKFSRYIAVLLLLTLLLIQASASEQFTGKVVGITDGDTLSVLREGTAVKLRITAA